ncbi:dihydrofolate reductase family protein [Microbacterium aureliae]
MAVSPPHVVFFTAATLDGYLADDVDSLAWLFAVPGAAEAEEGIGGFLDDVSVLVMGSTTYRWVVEHEDLDAHPERWPAMYGDRPTFVFSSRVQPSLGDADIRVRQGDVDLVWDEIAEAAAGGVVWLVGGGDLVGQFADRGHLDEIRVSIAPVTLGGGRPLLPRRLESDRLTLTSVGRTGQFAELRYAVAPPGAT